MEAPAVRCSFPHGLREQQAPSWDRHKPETGHVYAERGDRSSSVLPSGQAASPKMAEGPVRGKLPPCVEPHARSEMPECLTAHGGRPMSLWRRKSGGSLDGANAVRAFARGQFWRVVGAGWVPRRQLPSSHVRVANRCHTAGRGGSWGSYLRGGPPSRPSATERAVGATTRINFLFRQGVDGTHGTRGCLRHLSNATRCPEPPPVPRVEDAVRPHSRGEERIRAPDVRETLVRNCELPCFKSTATNRAERVASVRSKEHNSREQRRIATCLKAGSARSQRCAGPARARPGTLGSPPTG